jgi:hypothetical protein
VPPTGDHERGSLGGWNGKALDQFEARVDEGFRLVDARLDAQRADLNVLMGTTHDDAAPADSEPRVGRWRVADVIGFVSLCLVPVILELIRRGG